MTWITSTVGASLVAAFFFGALLGSVFSRDRKDAQQDQSNSDKLDYPSDKNEKTSIAALARAHIAFAKDVDSTNKQQTAHSKKAYRVNFWTAIGVGAYTVFTAVIVVFSVVQYGETHRFNKKQLRFLNDQLTEMRSSSRQTDQTIQILRDQAKTAYEQLVSSNRAFVYFSSFNIHERDLGKTIGISPVWGNSGNTPTLGLAITTGCLQLGIQAGEPFDHINESERSTIKFVLAPKAMDNVLTCTLPIGFIGELNAGRVVLYIIGEARYFDDITKTEKRLTQFSRQIASINPNNVADFSIRLVGAHNCADDDCPK
jgi:hypothetical protein